MENEKIENLLNLALDATEEEREKSLDLDVGYVKAEQAWEVIVKYSGTKEELEGIFAKAFPQDYMRIHVTKLMNEYAILRLPTKLVEPVAGLLQIAYMEKPKRLFFAVQQGKRASCITPLQSGYGMEQTGAGLSGKNVVVAVIDSGDGVAEMSAIQLESGFGFRYNAVMKNKDNRAASGDED